MSMQPHPVNRLLTNEDILIAGPNGLLNGAVAAAAQQNGCRLVRVAQGRSHLARILDSWQPTIVVLDLELAAADQFEIVRFLRKQRFLMKIVAMAFQHDDPQLLIDAFIVGIDGVASKDLGVESLLKVLEVVCSGESAVPRDLNRIMISNLRDSTILKRSDVSLTGRQQEVLRLITEGLTDRDISLRLNISQTTVRTHLAAIFEKTATENRTSAARWASRVWLDDAAS
jgi:DNA-binding NarL/FixJ family response regulator